MLELKASEEFVAPNSYSLAEAYCGLRKAVEKGKPHLCDVPYAIINDETVVGFLMVAFENGEDVFSDGDIYWIGRLMIDEKRQGKGYGKAAMAKRLYGLFFSIKLAIDSLRKLSVKILDGKRKI